MKRLILLALAIFALAIPFLACGTDTTGTNTGTAVTATASEATPTPAAHFKIGQTVKVGTTWQIIVHGAKASPGGQFDSLKAGDAYLEIDVSLKNITAKEQNTSSLIDWNIQDSTGQKYSSSFASDAPSGPDGKVEAGSTLRGTLVYEVPKAEKHYTLSFAPDLLSSGQTIWDITV